MTEADIRGNALVLQGGDLVVAFQAAFELFTQVLVDINRIAEAQEIQAARTVWTHERETGRPLL